MKLRNLTSEAQIIRSNLASIAMGIGDEEYFAFLGSVFGSLGRVLCVRSLRYENDEIRGHLASKGLYCCLRAAFEGSDGLRCFLTDFLSIMVG